MPTSASTGFEKNHELDFCIGTSIDSLFGFSFLTSLLSLSTHCTPPPPPSPPQSPISSHRVSLAAKEPPQPLRKPRRGSGEHSLDGWTDGCDGIGSDGIGLGQRDGSTQDGRTDALVRDLYLVAVSARPSCPSCPIVCPSYPDVSC